MLKGILQEVMKAELDMQLGHDKQKRHITQVNNYKNAVPKKYRNGTAERLSKLNSAR